ncbi:hypothetical protein N1851_003510 [Merluccius polli]|uniref:Uncharacterized protein n=1 Tax=Merluccius polli TaxID=89951 RepID=A0AA47P7V5_MERPO|nr:hypothetical protein N1851_003510 [Merluccius polli]
MKCNQSNGSTDAVASSVSSTMKPKTNGQKERKIVQKSTFGWVVVHGPDSVSSTLETTCMNISLEDTQVSKELHAFWEIESLVKIPWRQDKPDLVDNFRVAKKRFESLKKRLKADVTLHVGYLQEGICEDIPVNYMTPEKMETVKYCLPHHAVFREDKATTKLRIMFDASSHENC